MSAPTLLDLQRRPFGPLFVQTATRTIANTLVETSLFTTGVGSLTIPANFMQVGHNYLIRIVGYISDTGTPNKTLRVKIGGTTLNTTTVASVASLSNEYWEMLVNITVRSVGAAGSVWMLGRVLHHLGAGIVTPYLVELVNTAVTNINTTIANALDVTFQWGTANAANTISIPIATAELMNPGI